MKTYDKVKIDKDLHMLILFLFSITSGLAGAVFLSNPAESRLLYYIFFSTSTTTVHFFQKQQCESLPLVLICTQCPPSDFTHKRSHKAI